MPERQPIPNINIGQVYDQRYADAEVHYDALGNLAGFFGRNMPVHRHDRFFQVHYVKNGAVRVYLDERQYLESGPMFFLTPPTVPHAFVTEADADGHVLTVRQQLVWSLTEAEPGLAPGPQVAPACVALGNLEGGAAEEAARLALLFEQLRSESMASRPGRQQMLLALTRLVMISLLRLSANSVAARPMRHEDLQIFQRFNALIEERYAESTGRCRSTPAGSASPRRASTTSAGASPTCRRSAWCTNGLCRSQAPAAVHRRLGERDLLPARLQGPGLLQSFLRALRGAHPSAYRQRQADGESRR